MKLIDHAGTWRPGKRRALAWHRNNGLEVVCVTGGTAEWRVQNETYRVPAGSVFFTFPWEWHGNTCETVPGLELTFVIIRLDRMYRTQPPGNRFGWHPQIPFTANESRQIKRALLGVSDRSLPLSETMLRLVRHLARERQSEDLGAGVNRRSLAAQVLVELARIATAQAETTGRQIHDTDRRVLAFIKQMEASCHEPWSVDSMASACGLGRARLTDIVRKHTGDTPLMLMNRLRIQRAQRLLIDTDTKVTDVAFSCGFSTSQHFCRVFRDYAGCTPSQYRKNSPELSDSDNGKN